MTKIVKSEGCTAFYTRIDGRDLDELSLEEKETLLTKLISIHKKYGIDSTNKLQSVKDKKKVVFIERYGVDNPMKDTDFKSKHKNSIKNKIIHEI